MNMTEKELPASPQVLKALRTGFDAITRHIGLALFPLGIDLLLWFAPHLRLKEQIERLVLSLEDLSALGAAQQSEYIEVSQEMWQFFAERLNILIAVRTYPVGVFSLLSTILPLENPLGSPRFIQLPSVGLALLIAIGAALVGIGLGSLYFSAVAQAALYDEIRWRDLFQNWGWVSLQSGLISLLWLVSFAGFLGLSVCFVTGIALISMSLAQVVMLFMITLLIWLLFPLFFSAHGVFVRKFKAWQSLLAGLKLTNLTFVKTGLFILVAFLFTQGMGLVWQIAPEDSWLMLISILGNAFISTGLLAASFIYYQDSMRWKEEMLALHQERSFRLVSDDSND